MGDIKNILRTTIAYRPSNERVKLLCNNYFTWVYATSTLIIA